MDDLLISLHTDQHIKDAVNIFGYAYGYNRICKHFNEYSYGGRKLTARQNSKASQVQMFYMEPEWYNLSNMQNLRSPDFKKFHDHQYKIYGTHLEATEVWPHWIDTMNQADEIWVGNPFARDAVLNSGVTTPTYVFEHGIDDMWKPYRRGKNDKIRFLHVDSDSPRKRADMVEKAFTELFDGNPDYELTLKYHGDREYQEIGLEKFIEKYSHGSNVNKIYATLTQEELVQLYYSHDVLVYPSEGEGFGFIPLQALATGMPVISTSRWCSYDHYFKDNIIESKLGKTTYTGYYAGEVILADYDSLLYQMKKVADDIETQCDFYYKQAKSVYNKYNWQNMVDEFLDSFIDRVGVEKLEPIEEYRSDNNPYFFYEGSGTYSTKCGAKFSTENRVWQINKNSAVSLNTNPLFRPASVDEIKTIDPYYL